MTGVWSIYRFNFWTDLPADRKAVLVAAMAAHEAACAISFTEVTAPGLARLVASSAAVRPDGTPFPSPAELADTQEPTPGLAPTAQLMMVFNEASLASLSPDIFLNAALHELGHFLGRQHSDPVTDSVMYSVINPAAPRTALTSYDLNELQSAYGAPAPAPTPQVPMTPQDVAAAAVAAVANAPAGTGNAHPFLHAVAGALSSLPAEVAQNVNFPELVKAVLPGLVTGKAGPAILEDIAAAAALIFPEARIALVVAELLKLVVLAAQHKAAAA